MRVVVLVAFAAALTHLACAHRANITPSGIFKGTWELPTQAADSKHMLRHALGVLYIGDFRIRAHNTNAGVDLVEGKLNVRDGSYITDDMYMFAFQGLHFTQHGVLVLMANPLQHTPATLANSSFAPGRYTNAQDIEVAYMSQQLSLPKNAAQSPSSVRDCYFQGTFTATPEAGDTSVLHGRLDSPNCRLGFRTRVRPWAPGSTEGATGYIVMLYGVAIVEVVVLFRQMAMSSSQTIAAKMAPVAIAMQGLLDTYFCLIHLVASVVFTEALFYAFATASFLYFIKFSMFNMQFMINTFKARNPQIFNGSYDGFLLSGFLLVFYVKGAFWFVMFVSFSFWVPQIYSNARYGHSKSLMSHYVIMTSVCRLFVPTYFLAWPNNFTRIEPHPMIVFWLWVYLGVQCAVLYLQDIRGPRFFIPKRFLPPKYEYHRPLPEEVDEATVECVICMSRVNGPPSGPDSDIEAQAAAIPLRTEAARDHYMVTPCTHVFHSQCLLSWMDHNLVCPTCQLATISLALALAQSRGRQPLPPDDPHCSQRFLTQGDELLNFDLSGADILSPAFLDNPQGGGARADYEAVEVITPEVIPYNITRICFAATFYNIIDAEVVVYDDVYGRPALKPSWSSRVVLSRDNIRDQPRWWTAQPDLVIYQRRVHIGYRVSTLQAMVTLGSMDTFLGRQTFIRASPTGSASPAAWTPLVNDWANGNYSALLLRFVGRPLQTRSAPPSWRCEPASFSDGRVCDCECGAWDPDCNVTVAGPLGNCSEGSVCDRRGHCVDPRWNVSACNLSSFGAGDGCQCECGGMLDPDCRNNVIGGDWYPRAVNCAGYNVAMCSDNNTCVETWPGCSGSKYDNGFCDCSCQRQGGVMDIDCIYTNVSDCGDWHCDRGSCRNYPHNWTCKPAVYLGDCICGCGYLKPVCGDRVVETYSDHPEECDSGRWCHRKTCQCEPGYMPTVPLSHDCIPICGDDTAVPGQDCDGGQFCNVTSCKCEYGHSPYSPPRQYCKGCGNGVLDDGEPCDGGSGCANCTCSRGHIPTVPPSLSCVENKCGNAVADRGEQCDSGAFCDGCKCTEGHAPFDPPRPYCKGCNNGVLEADLGEQCDGGSACTNNCTCPQGFKPTDPPSGTCIVEIACQPIRSPLRTSLKANAANAVCGNKALDDGEECDGELYCEKCKCSRGHSPYRPPRKYCTGCHNGVMDEGELCDGGLYCTTNCTCPTSYQPTDPPSITCQAIVSRCGNKVVEPEAGEECDSGAFCFSNNCTCEPGHRPFDKRRTYCTGCPNGNVDTGEECDGGSGCTLNCTCAAGYRPSSSPVLWCTADEDTSNLNYAIAIGVPSAVAAVAVVALVAVVITRKRFTKKVLHVSMNLPIEQSTSVYFADVPSANIKANNAAKQKTPPSPVVLAPYVHSKAPDGTPIIVVPVCPSVTGLSPLPLEPPLAAANIDAVFADLNEPVVRRVHRQLPQIARDVQARGLVGTPIDMTTFVQNAPQPTPYFVTSLDESVSLSLLSSES
eukprot:m51a1_g4147 hypothetical protein (1503) ;mRNA; r:237576-243772